MVSQSSHCLFLGTSKLTPIKQWGLTLAVQMSSLVRERTVNPSDKSHTWRPRNDEVDYASRQHFVTGSDRSRNTITGSRHPRHLCDIAVHTVSARVCQIPIHRLKCSIQEHCSLTIWLCCILTCSTSPPRSIVFMALLRCLRSFSWR